MCRFKSDHTPVSGLFDLMGMVRWLTRDAIRMAQECYEVVDPTTMKILADNIEELMKNY